MPSVVCNPLVYRMYRSARVRNGTPRNYRLSYACETRKQRRGRELRRRNRARAMKKGRVRKGDSLVIHHADHNVFNNRASNLKILTASAHRRLHTRARR